MILNLKAFDVPTRPATITLWGPSQAVMHLMALGVLGYFAGWLAVPLIGYILIVEGVFVVRELFWNRYADRVDGTFVRIGQASSELAEQLHKIAVEVEARTAADQATPPAETPQVTSGGVCWAATSKGRH